MSDILTELKQKRTAIEGLQTTKARQEGQRDQVLQQLKEKFKVTSVKEGEKKSKELSEKLTENRNELEELDSKMDSIIREAQPKEAQPKRTSD